MKKFIVLLTVLLFYFPAITQESLIGEDVEHGGYGGLLLRIGQINGETGILLGAHGAWVLDHRFILGGMWNGLVNNVKIDNLENTKLELDYGGGMLGYIVNPNKLLHFDVQSMIGVGKARYEVINYEDPHSDINFSGDKFFVFEPSVNLILNVNKKIKIGAGTTYRYVSGVEYETLSNGDLKGVSGQIFLNFGVF